MWKIAQGALSAVAGTAEPVYGKEAVHPVTGSSEALEIADLRWIDPPGTNVETQTFYFIHPESKYAGFVQLIHSHITPLSPSVQFTCRVWHPSDLTTRLWTSTNLPTFEFSNDHKDIKGDNTYVKLSEDGNTYAISSSANSQSVVDLKFSRMAPGLKIGDATTRYGQDKLRPWGSMRHVFWLSASVEGHIVAKGQALDLTGAKGMFVMAMQGMKPHHAAARWNFMNFQSENISAIMMEFTTPYSYGSTRVNVGGVSEGDNLVIASLNNTATHTDHEQDEEAGWPMPRRVLYNWDDGKAILDAPMSTVIEKINVMAEVPGVVRSLATSLSGAKPYIYQFCNSATIHLHVNDKETVEEGTFISESTFIC